VPEIPPGARHTPLVGLAQRITQAARYVVSSVRPDTWFGPFQPLGPMAPDQEGVKGRQWDFPTGLNLNYIPRSDAPITFGELKALSRACDLLRIAIESRKDQIASLDYVIRPREAAAGEPSLWYKQGAKAHPEIPAAQQKRIDAITDFFRYPDREQPWDMWVKEWMETVFVIDAPAIWRRRDRSGKLYALELLDGAMIKPIIGADGRRPKPPDVAYQQILHGVPAADFTTEELLYIPWNPRVDSSYGYSKVEQILVTINTAIRRSMFQLNWYTEGSQPDAFMGLPKEWNLTQIKDFQDYMDSLLAGNLATRRKLRFVPGEFKYQETKSPPLKDQFDEFLARIICFTFAIAPDPFIEHVSRGAVEKSHTRALEEGLEPNQRYVKAVIDRVIWEDFNSPDLEFKYVENREQDPKDQMTIDVGYVKSAIYAIDEVRVERGKVPLGGPFSEPMLATATGFIPVGALTSPNVMPSLAAAGGPAAQALVHQAGGGSRGEGGGGNPNAAPQNHVHTPANPSKNMGEPDEEEDEIEELLKYGDPAPAVNGEASQGGSGDWWPNQPPMTTPANDLPRQFPRPRGSAWGGGANDWDYSQRTPRSQLQVGRHPAPQTQPRLDYYHHSIGKALALKGIKTSSGVIDSDDEIPIDLPQASDDERAHLDHVAWKRVQSRDFKLVPRTVSIDKVRATQPTVDRDRLLHHIKGFEEHGESMDDLPLYLEMNGLYYILDGHHKTTAAKLIGWTTIIADLLEGTDGGSPGEKQNGGSMVTSRAHLAPSGHSDLLAGGKAAPPVDFDSLESELSTIGTGGK
jgi:hypothetical protein